MTRERFSKTLFVLWAASLGLWIVAATAFVPSLIVSAYHGKSTPYLNSLITGQAAYSLGHYLEVWESMSRSVLFQLFAAGALLLFVTHPDFQRRVERSQKNQPAPLPGMGRARYASVSSFLIVLIGASLWCIYRNEELWPFSQYSMYAGFQAPRVETVKLFGVSSQGEIPFERELILPFDEGRLELALYRLSLSAEGDALVERALRDCLHRYEQNRRLGRHDGPELTALRAVETVWDVSRGVPDEPEKRMLRYEVRRDG